MARISYRNKIRLKKLLRALLILAGCLLVVSIVMTIYLEPYILYDRDGAHLSLSQETVEATAPSVSQPRPVVENPQIVYSQGAPVEKSIQEMGGYYITTAMLQKPEAVFEEIKAIQEPCAVMIQLKSIFGNFYYSSSIAGAPKADVAVSVIDEMISYLSDNGFYLIAEIPAFSDPVFALDHQSCGLPLSSGALWMDENGCYWLDPANEDVQSFLMQIARELANRGFHEIAFSGFRFPDTTSISYNSEKSKADIIADAASQLTSFFANSSTVLSFVTDAEDFPVASCAGRIYINDVAGSRVEHYVQLYSEPQTLREIVFITNSRDTRFEEQAVLRPLIAD